MHQAVLRLLLHLPESVLHFHFLGVYQPRLLFHLGLIHLDQRDWHFCLRDTQRCCPRSFHHRPLLRSRDQVVKNIDPDRFFCVRDDLETWVIWVVPALSQFCLSFQLLRTALANVSNFVLLSSCPYKDSGICIPLVNYQLVQGWLHRQFWRWVNLWGCACHELGHMTRMANGNVYCNLI